MHLTPTEGRCLHEIMLCENNRIRFDVYDIDTQSRIAPWRNPRIRSTRAFTTVARMVARLWTRHLIQSNPRRGWVTTEQGRTELAKWLTES